MILRKTPKPLHPRPRPLPSVQRPSNHPRHASTTVSSAVAPASELDGGAAPIQRYPPLQPPSLKPVHLRKSQLHRQYTSLLQSAPLMLVFQHNNLKASEWAGIRRELDSALKKVDDVAAAKAQSLTGADVDGMRQGDTPEGRANLQVITTNIFAAALRVVEHYNPSQDAQGPTTEASGAVPAAAQHAHTPTHYLSKEAYDAATIPSSKGGTARKKPTSLDALLSGPIAVLAFPTVAPSHLAAALRILAPTPGSQSAFPAPRRRDAPGLYEPGVQVGLQKLMLLGARVNGKAFDRDGVSWVGSLAGRGGLEGLRGEVVALLQSVGLGLVGGLDRIGMSVWGTLEGRRQSMEGEQGEGTKGDP